MASIVGAFGVPHIPLIASKPGVADKKQREKVFDAFATIRKRLAELEVDTVIIVGDDHYTVFGPHCLPSILIGFGDVDGPFEDWLGHERAPIPGNPALATHIMNYGFEHGFDWAAAKSLTVDHSVFVPYLKLVKEGDRDIRTIPVYVGAGVEPLIRPKRCIELGEMISAAINAYDGNDRVAIVGTGGLSHWVGAAEMGKINEEFDHNILEMIKNRDIEGLLSFKNETVLKTAGNGALEYRNWLVAIGAVEKYDYELLCYEPIHGWVTGTGLVELKVAAA